MRKIGDVLVEELDPETQAICDAVCGALAAVTSDDPWAEPDYRSLPDFGYAWGVALEKAPEKKWPGCRKRVMEALEQRVRNDPNLWISQGGSCAKRPGGPMYTREMIRQYHGRESYVVDSQTGEMRQMIEWPTGTYAGGNPSYERPEAA